tara:strand:- start:4485 stop:4739 length:255 start_codon:yes stop_codon:yes gene_type:complete
MSTEQLEKDIAYCIDDLDLTNEEIGDILRACEKLGGISVEYFCEEFIFICEDEDGNEDVDALNRVHDDDYLQIQWRLDDDHDNS